MKISLLFLILLFSSLLNAAETKSSGSWAMLYGYSQNKNDLNITPAGNTYKVLFGSRNNKFEFNLLVRYGKLTDDITYSTINGKITHSNVTGGVQFGFWLLPWLKLHAGYARHFISEDVSGSYSQAQQNAITNLYKLDDRKTNGIYGGGDLVLLQSSSVQLFANYDYYRLNSLSAHEWEVMGGLRFYLGSSKSGEENMLSKYFKKIFGPTSM